MPEQMSPTNTPEELFNHAVSLQETGSLQDAIEIYRELLSHFPSAVILHQNIALAYADSGNFQDAHDHSQKAAELSPNDPAVQFNLAYSYKNIGFPQQAAEIYESLLQSDTNQPEVLYNLANCYKELGKNEQAISSYQKVLSLVPDHKSATNNLAFILHKNDQLEDAIVCYKKLLEIDSENISARYILSVLTGEDVIECPPDTYIQEVFDSYSDHYDKSLVDDLEYCVPQKMLSALDSLGLISSLSTVLDLGCGSGLAAETLSPYCSSFTGVDLSSKMLSLASDKKLYHELYCSPIEAFLDTADKHYDLLLAADVFAYFGSLKNVFTKARSTAHSKTIFSFSVEINSSDGYTVRKSGRFAHSVEYVCDTLQTTGWKTIYNEQTGIRKERNDWINGLIVVAVPI